MFIENENEKKKHKKRDPNCSINVQCPCTVLPIQSNAFIQYYFVPDSIHCPVCFIFIGFVSLAHRTIANLKPDWLNCKQKKKHATETTEINVAEGHTKNKLHYSITIIIDIERIY